MNITVNTTLNEIKNSPLGFIYPCLMSCAEKECDMDAALTIEGIHKCIPTWNAHDVVSGLKRIDELHANGIDILHSVYSSEEIASEPLKKQVQLMWMPSSNRTHSTFVLILAGGAYGTVCTLSEGLPVAAYLNAQGYDCFCLNYRTKKDEYYAEGLLPRPYDDIAAAFGYIAAHNELFGVDVKDYAIGGFSAGGHAAAMWGCKNVGARHYGIAQPCVILGGYPVISMEFWTDNANPNSMAASLRSLSAIRSLSGKQGNRVAILGDMKELGDDSAQLHYSIGRLAAELGVDEVLCCGDEAKNIYDGYIAAGGKKGYHFAEKEQLMDDLSAFLGRNDVVLVKASHSMEFPEIVKAIKNTKF